MKYLQILRHVSIVGLILLATALLISLQARLGAHELRNAVEATDENSQNMTSLDAERRRQNFTATLHVIQNDSSGFDSPSMDGAATDSSSQPFQVLDELQEYAQACDAAIGVTVPDFNCDAPEPQSSEVPTTNPGDGKCDRPNQLNQECDPGSRFQMLTDGPDVYVAAHCRKKGLGPGRYGDIAVIQYNRNNGATCFYQALGNLNGNVQAPSKGTGGFWMTPLGIRDSEFPCASCHDNGPFIRSPYLTQITGANALPGAGISNFNKDEPYYFVGSAFANWKAYKVEVHDTNGNLNVCNTCHRMGVNNLTPAGNGTALDFGIRSTAASQVAKNPHSPNSPIWMTPDRRSFPEGQQYSQANADAAQAIRACALRWTQNSLPNDGTCRITLFAGSMSSCAGQIYVDRAYNGPEQGTMANPFRTVGAAYNYACNGAQLHIKAGSYPETLNMSKNVTLIAEGGTVAIGQ